MYRTLVVEDEAQEARHLTDLLTRYGKQHGVEFKVTWHSSAMEMLSDKGHYDLCLLDIEMPGINGMEAAGYFAPTTRPSPSSLLPTWPSMPSRATRWARWGSSSSR